MNKEQFNKIVRHFAKVREQAEPRPEQTDEEKQLAQEGLLKLMEEIKPLRERANSRIL